MPINTSQLHIWKGNLNRSRVRIISLLEEAKKNGGKNETIRKRLKQELNIAKQLKKTIKLIEQTINTDLTCPCCGCVVIFDDSENKKLIQK